MKKAWITSLLKQRLQGNRVLNLLLLSYTIFMFQFSAFGNQSLVVEMPLLMFVPGYAFLAFFFRRLNGIELIIGSLGLSISFFVGLSNVLNMFALTSYFSEAATISFLSAACLVAQIAKERRI